jgi:hypothetical protein
MRAIIIEEDRFSEVTTLMREAASNAARHGSPIYGWPEGMSEQSRQILADSVYRAIHFEFVRWAQSHGASCVKR